MNIADFLPLELWKNALLHPKEIFAKEKANASIMAGAKQLAVGGALGGLVLSVLGLLAGNALGLFFVPFYAILQPLFVFVYTAIFWIIAKLLGGKGSYSEQYYVTALFSAPLFPLINLPWLGFLVGFYGIYLAYLMLKEVHGFSTTRVILVLLIAGGIWLIVSVLASLALLMLIPGFASATLSTTKLWGLTAG